jgi:GNAT superfamily N-acetyltransferase
MAPSDAALSFGVLHASELADAEALVAGAGWNQTADDWRVFLAEGKVHAVRDGGRVIATAATLPYGGQFGWISMVLVRQDYQRRGIARDLLRRCIDDLTGAGLVAVLDATPAGREVYRGLGFQDSWGFQRFAAPQVQIKPAGLAPGISIRPIDDASWPTLCAYDAAAFGADRTGLLANLRKRLPQAALVAERDGAISGFLLGRDGRVATQLGPLIAEDDETTRALLSRALSGIRGQVFIDVADARRDTVASLTGQGFVSQRPLTRMLLGRSHSFDDGQRTYAVAGPEFG